MESFGKKIYWPPTIHFPNEIPEAAGSYREKNQAPTIFPLNENRLALPPPPPQRGEEGGI